MKPRPIIFWSLVLGGLGFLGMRLSSIIGPFFLGWLLAYALNPIVTLLQRRTGSRLGSTVITLICVASLMAGAIHITLPLLIHEGLALSERLPEMITTVTQRLNASLPYGSEHNFFKAMDLGQLTHDSMGSIVQGLSHILSHVFSSGQSLVSGMLVFLIMLLSAFYFLRDWESMVISLQKGLPRAYESQICTYAREVHETLARYIRGQVSVCCVSAIGHTLGLWCVHLEGAALIGIISGFLAFIPYGALSLGMTTALMMAMLQWGTIQACLLIASVFIVMHMIETNLLVPKLVGGEIGLHPLWMIFIFFAAAELFGFWGVLFALPLAACLKVFAHILLGLYRKSPYYTQKIS